MIKMVATDIDGTLIQDGSHILYEEMYDMILKLKEKGVVFVAASGRQYPSIRKLFEPVKNEMIFIAENGAHVVCRGIDMAVTRMNRPDVRELILQLRKMEGCHFTASSKEGTYVESKDPGFLDLMINGYHNDIVEVEDVLAEKTNFIKVAVYREAGISQEMKETLIPQFEERMKIVVAGSQWLDFMDKSVDKGNAIATIQTILGFSKEETMVFGDNPNDLGMIARAKESYAVETADPEVLKAANHIAKTYKEKGVYQVLNHLVEQL